MINDHKHAGLILLTVTIFIFSSIVFSFGSTTTSYTYDDVNHTITIERGTPGTTPTYSISGIVTDSNGNPLSGVTVSLSGAVTASTTTDSNGFYGFSVLNNGSFTVTPNSSSYTFTPVRRSVTISGADAIAQDFMALVPPLGPSGLTASGISSGQINLSWTDNSTTETGFEIWRKTGFGGTYSRIGVVGSNVTSYSDTGLSGGTSYYYMVRAYNGAGYSGYSNETYATTACSNANLPVRLVGKNQYTSLQAAYGAASNGDTIQSQAVTLSENVTINRNISVTLQGGYDCGYTTSSGKITYLKGMLQTVSGGGTLTISNINLVQ